MKTALNEPKMIVRVWTKPQTQQTIKALRKAGYPVKRINHGYELKDRDGNLYFKAMNGQYAYLVLYSEQLLTEER